MESIYIQNYFINNYIFIGIVIGIYFTIFMRSAIEKTIKNKIFLIVNLLLILSILDFYIEYLKKNNQIELYFLLLVQIYYFLEGLIMPLMLKIVTSRIRYIYIPIVINFFIGSIFIFSNYTKIIEYQDIAYILKNFFIVIVIIYWIIFLIILEQIFYKDIQINHLQVFCAIAWLMLATIVELMDSKKGVLIETYAIIFLFYYLMLHIKISERVSEEKEMKLREQRMTLMLSQIQPHFLYNTLNTITALCRLDSKLAEQTTIKFSEYLRKNMVDIGKNDIQHFSKELEHTKLYINIEQLRFGDRVKVEYDIQIQDFFMPTLTLQPIVENAIKHGICTRIKGGVVKISTKKQEKNNIIVISDNGVGFDTTKVLKNEEEHIGLYNVRERLKNIINAELEISSFIGIGTEVKIIIPKNRKKIELEGGKRREILSIGR